MTTTPLPAGSLRATSLNLGRRERELTTLGDGQRLDVLVVGGGVTGAGAALDAAARGLSVALVESEDLAWGASRWTSKLLHGSSPGRSSPWARREAAVERGILMTRTAPHLTRAVPQLVPLHEHVSCRTEGMLVAEAAARDGLRRTAGTPSALLPPPHRAPAAEALALVPGLHRRGLRGGVLHFEAQLVDDARLVVALARTAAGFGARVLTRVRAETLHHDGADIVDRRTGEALRLRAAVVINATGVWATELDPDIRVHHRRGSHLVIDPDAAGIAATAVTCPPSGRRGESAFVLPQPEGHALLGVTDEPLDEPAPVADVPESDMDSLLVAMRDVLDTPLERRHVLGSFSATQSVVESNGATGRRGRPSRTVVTGTDGPVTALGESLTTYRRTAAEAVDTAVTRAGLAAGPSRTRAVPLVGAAEPARIATIDVDPHLVGKYGTEAPRLAALAELDAGLADPVVPGNRITAAEVVWAVRHEGALDSDDVLDRRTRLGIDPEARERARAPVEHLVTQALQGVLG